MHVGMAPVAFFDRRKAADVVRVRMRQHDMANVLRLLAKRPNSLKNLVRTPGKPVSIKVQPSDDSSKNVFTGPTGITYSPWTICVAAIRSLRNTELKLDLYLFGYEGVNRVGDLVYWNLCRCQLEFRECVINHED